MWLIPSFLIKGTDKSEMIRRIDSPWRSIDPFRLAAYLAIATRILGESTQ